MRLGILSDTHDEVDRTRLAVRVLRDAGADALVHCGDLASPPVLEALAELPCWFVFGNHDADSVPALRQAAADLGPTCLGWAGLIGFGGVPVGVAHGHMTSDLRRVLADRPEYLLTGHSHIPSDTTFGGVRRINPGALHRADEYTAAVLDLPTGALQFLRVPR